MASLVKELIEAGIHFGQRRSNWNPKMRPYIFATRNQIHIIDIKETIKGLLLARKLIQNVTAQGKDVVDFDADKAIRVLEVTRPVYVDNDVLILRALTDAFFVWERAAFELE